MAGSDAGDQAKNCDDEGVTRFNFPINTARAFAEQRSGLLAYLAGGLIL